MEYDLASFWDHQEMIYNFLKKKRQKTMRYFINCQYMYILLLWGDARTLVNISNIIKCNTGIIMGSSWSVYFWKLQICNYKFYFLSDYCLNSVYLTFLQLPVMWLRGASLIIYSYELWHVQINFYGMKYKHMHWDCQLKGSFPMKTCLIEFLNWSFRANIYSDIFC